MYKLTTFEAPFVHYQCGCMRQFAGEEMYLCFKCNKSLCRFCLHEDEIETFYCRFCLDPIPVVKAPQEKNQCSRYLECPLCFSVTQISISAGRDKFYYYVCMFCKWDSIAVNIKAKSLNAIIHKVPFYKGKFLVSPQQDMFAKLLEVLKFNLEEQTAIEKKEMRSKKKSNVIPSFFNPAKVKPVWPKFTMEDLAAKLDEKRQI